MNRRLSLESYEERALLAACAITHDAVDGVVYAACDEGRDHLVLSDAGNNEEVLRINGTLQGPFSGVNRYEIRTGRGNDRIVSNISKPIYVYAGSGNDEISTADGDDVIDAGSGNDTVMAGAGHDQIFGDIGNDQLFGEAGDDILIGNAGNDMLQGGAGNDILTGDEGVDHLMGGIGNDLLSPDLNALDPVDPMVDAGVLHSEWTSAGSHAEALYDVTYSEAQELALRHGTTVTVDDEVDIASCGADTDFVFDFGADTVTDCEEVVTAPAVEGSIRELVYSTLEANGGVIYTASQRYDDVPLADPDVGHFSDMADEGWYLGENNCADTGVTPCYANPEQAPSMALAADVVDQAYVLSDIVGAPDLFNGDQAMNRLAWACAIDPWVDPSQPLTQDQHEEMHARLNSLLEWGVHCGPTGLDPAVVSVVEGERQLLLSLGVLRRP